MNDFFEFENENMGGVQSFLFAPTKSILNIPKDINKVITSPIQFIPGSDFFKGLALRDSLSFEENKSDTLAGDIYNTVLSGMVPKLTPIYLNLFSQMVLKRYIILPTDNNGIKKLCGTIRAGMKFSFDQTTSTTPSGLNGFKFSFSLQYFKPSPFYMV